MVRWDTTKPTGDRKRVVDISRARALGFQPSVPLEEGIRETIEWYPGHRTALPGRYDVFGHVGSMRGDAV